MFSKRTSIRSLVGLTVACLCLSVAPGVASAGEPAAAKAGNVKAQVKKLRKQVKLLKRQVASLAGQTATNGAPGTTGPAGPEGAVGATGPQGPVGPLTGAAGGDLTGSYPNPQILPEAVSSLELAGHAITHDTSVINTANGNFTSKIANGAIGSTEIANGQVGPSDLGTIVERYESETVVTNSYQAVTVECLPGEQVISGGGAYNWTDRDSEILSSRRDGNGWTTVGYSTEAQPPGLDLRSYAYCLS